MRFRRVNNSNNNNNKMATTVSLDPRLHYNLNNHHYHKNHQYGAVTEEIPGLIRVTKDGRVERPVAVPTVPPTGLQPTPYGQVSSHDTFIDKQTDLWARVYVPAGPQAGLSVLVYFHGGGFCVGSAAWSCYHDFLASVCARAACVVVSVNYRLAPEHRLPAAYDDGSAALSWVRRGGLGAAAGQGRTTIFLGGDSAGANIAYHVAARAGNNGEVKGLVMIQPFFGAEARTASERGSPAVGSALTVAAADAYWRMALPVGSGRDHPYCNPLESSNSGAARVPGRVMVCVSEMDILKDRNMEMSKVLKGAGKRVEAYVYRGVGHAFQILNNSQFAQARTHEMLCHINNFVNAQ